MTLSIGRLENPIMPYAWGSRTAIAELMNRPSPSDGPEAELWMGAHPKAPSHIALGGRWTALDAAIARDPQAFLGEKMVRKFGPRLSFLLKILAVDAPLSIQAHPNKRQAEEGFALENRLGIAIDAPNRNFRDDHHKPELICAMTPFWVMAGFRPMAEMVSLFKAICPAALGTLVATLQDAPDAMGLSTFYRALMTLERSEKQSVLVEALRHAKDRVDADPAFQWVLALNAHYPEDIGGLSPLLLNVRMLSPGEALFLGAGTLHAYLKGVGIELMGNSDNVLRGGLTPKNVDVAALLRVARFASETPRILRPEDNRDGVSVYPSFVDDFELSVLTLSDAMVYRNDRPHGLEIFFVTEGAVQLTDERFGETLSLIRGQSALVPSIATPYRVAGDGVMYRASAGS